MPEGPATILGGLPVWAEVWYTRGDGWTTDDDCGVSHIFWLKRDGTKGKEVSQKIYDRLDKIDYWESDVCDKVFEHLAYLEWIEKNEQTYITLSSNTGPELWNSERTLAQSI